MCSNNVLAVIYLHQQHTKEVEKFINVNYKLLFLSTLTNAVFKEIYFSSHFNFSGVTHSINCDL